MKFAPNIDELAKAALAEASKRREAKDPVAAKRLEILAKKLSQVADYAHDRVD